MLLVREAAVWLLAAGSEVNRSRPWSAAFFSACYGQGAAVIEWNNRDVISSPDTSKEKITCLLRHRHHTYSVYPDRHHLF